MNEVDVNLSKQFNIKKNVFLKNYDFKSGFNKFVDSEYFFITLILIMGVFWFFQLNVPAIVFSLIYLSIIIWLKNDFKPVLMILASLCFVTRVTYGVACFLLLFSAFAFVVKNNLKIKYDKKMLISLVFLSIAVLFAGFLYKGKITSFVDAIALPAYILVCALFVLLYSCFDKDYLDYVLKILYYLGVFIALQLFVYYARFLEHFEMIFDYKLIYMGDSYTDSTTGWGISNHVGCLFLFTIPATLYMATKSKQGGLFYIPTFIQLVALVLTGSRGSLLFMGIFIVPMVAFSFVYAKSRKNNFMYIFIVFIVILTLMYVFRDFIIEILEPMLEKGMSSSGRDLIYIECIDMMEKNILFGVGNTYRAFGYAHSTIFQWMANAGLLGLVAIVYHLFVKYRPLIEKPSKSNIFGFCALIIPECYGMIDCNFFMANFMFLSAILIVSIYFNTEEKITEFKVFDTKMGLKELN